MKYKNPTLKIDTGETMVTADDDKQMIESSDSDTLTSILAHILERMIDANSVKQFVPPDEGKFIKFQSSYAPELSINSYLVRIQKYSKCSDACLVNTLIYIDKLILTSGLFLTRLNIHRLLITSLMLAAKFHDDIFYNNSFYAKLGGLPLQELNLLEVDLLSLLEYSLFISVSAYEKYFLQLKNYAATTTPSTSNSGPIIASLQGIDDSNPSTARSAASPFPLRPPSLVSPLSLEINNCNDLTMDRSMWFPAPQQSMPNSVSTVKETSTVGTGKGYRSSLSTIPHIVSCSSLNQYEQALLESMIPYHTTQSYSGTHPTAGFPATCATTVSTATSASSTTSDSSNSGLDQYSMRMDEIPHCLTPSPQMAPLSYPVPNAVPNPTPGTAGGPNGAVTASTSALSSLSSLSCPLPDLNVIPHDISKVSHLSNINSNNVHLMGAISQEGAGCHTTQHQHQHLMVQQSMPMLMTQSPHQGSCQPPLTLAIENTQHPYHHPHQYQNRHQRHNHFPYPRSAVHELGASAPSLYYPSAQTTQPSSRGLSLQSPSLEDSAALSVSCSVAGRHCQQAIAEPHLSIDTTYLDYVGQSISAWNNVSPRPISGSPSSSDAPSFTSTSPMDLRYLPYQHHEQEQLEQHVTVSPRDSGISPGSSVGHLLKPPQFYSRQQKHYPYQQQYQQQHPAMAPYATNAAQPSLMYPTSTTNRTIANPETVSMDSLASGQHFHGLPNYSNCNNYNYNYNSKASSNPNLNLNPNPNPIPIPIPNSNSNSNPNPNPNNNPNQSSHSAVQQLTGQCIGSYGTPLLSTLLVATKL